MSEQLLQPTWLPDIAYTRNEKSRLPLAKLQINQAAYLIAYLLSAPDTHNPVVGYPVVIHDVGIDSNTVLVRPQEDHLGEVLFPIDSLTLEFYDDHYIRCVTQTFPMRDRHKSSYHTPIGLYLSPILHDWDQEYIDFLQDYPPSTNE